MSRIARPTQPRPLKERRTLRVLISGASGFIGTELCRQLEADGHTVLRLVRRPAKSESEFSWAPTAQSTSSTSTSSTSLDPALIDSVDAVVNLSGASTGRIPWTRGYKKTILDSRVQPTQAIAEAMNLASSPPEVFLSASAVGFYGDQPGFRLTEQSAHGHDFLSGVVEAWEQAAHLASATTRVVTFRTGLVVGRGGAFTPLTLLTKLGLASRMGTGGQHWPWISLYDEAAAIRHLLSSQLSGPVNLAGPTPATSDRITRHLAHAMHRWQPFAIPEPFIRVGFGEAGQALLLTSQKVIPARLVADGFSFRHDTVEQAIDAMMTTA